MYVIDTETFEVINFRNMSEIHRIKLILRVFEE